MRVQRLVFGFVLFFMGLIGEYVGRIYLSLNKQPQFVVKEKVESEIIEEWKVLKDR